MKGRILVINTGSTSTKIGFYEDGQKSFEQNITLDKAVLAKYSSVMDLDLEFYLRSLYRSIPSTS